MTLALRLLATAATFAEIVTRALADGFGRFADSIAASQDIPDTIPDSLTTDVVWP